MRILVTGGLGFIGSAVIRFVLDQTDHEIINVDKVSYASTESSIEEATRSNRYQFRRCDLADFSSIQAVVSHDKPDAVIHLAAESHVDRSIEGPRAFAESNMMGTFNLLEAVRTLPGLQRFVHVSTDEVFGSLKAGDQAFDESTAYQPRSPYSATKAASDHLVRAWGETYGLPCSVTNCSNNYGPYQFPEKMVPLMIIKAWLGEPLPVYGRGENIRDWLFVADHAAALVAVLENGQDGRSYAIGGENEVTNLDAVNLICEHVNRATGDSLDRHSLVEFVTDRPGHDFRYAVDCSRIKSELGWRPSVDFHQGLEQTIQWYLKNRHWWEPLLARTDGGARIGLLEGQRS